MRLWLIAALMAMTVSTGAAAQRGPLPHRFENEIEAFKKADSARREPEKGTLFIGSSTVRLWDLRRSFAEGSVINRGFGGATTPELLYYYGSVVRPHRPAVIVAYIGENDIAAGATPMKVAGDVLMLLQRLRRDYPEARIGYVAMKPSPARIALWGRMDDANRMISARAASHHADFLDVGAALRGADGLPNPELYRADNLHLNDRGYAVLTSALQGYIGGAKPAVTAKVAR